MKNFISELRTTIAIIFIEHALDICPTGKFKVELAEFINKQIPKL